MNKLADHQTSSQISEIPSSSRFSERGTGSVTCLCHVCQRWHYDIQTGQQATSKQTILGYVIYV